MVDALIVSNLLLWVLVLALSAAVLALLRQVGVLHERVSPAGALVGRERVTVGEAAPIVDAESWRGEPLRVGGPSPEGAQTLLLFVSPTCPVCETLLPVVDRVAIAEGGASGVRVLIASDGPRDEHEAFVRAHGLADRRYVLSAELGLAYQVGRLPYAVLVDGAGVIRARGLVNTREHLESLFEARTLGMASMQDYLAEPRVGRGT